MAIDGEVLFIESRKFYFPSLRTLQKCMAIVAKRMHVLTDTDPFMMKKVGVDKGAIKFVLQGGLAHFFTLYGLLFAMLTTRRECDVPWTHAPSG